MNKLLLVLLCLLAIVIPVSARGKSDSERVYVFASDATWPPMEYIDDNGEIVGFDMDLLAAMAKAGDFKYKILNTGWDGIFAGLANGSYDAIISSVTITEERKQKMNFTTPYVNAGQILIVRNDYSGKEKLEDFAGKKVGVQQGTTGDFAVEVFAKIDRRAYDDVGLAIEDLANGNLDAVVCDSVTAVNFAVTNENYSKKLKIIGEPFTEEEYGIAVSKNNEELLAILNAALSQVFADGTHAKLVSKWLR